MSTTQELSSAFRLPGHALAGERAGRPAAPAALPRWTALSRRLASALRRPSARNHLLDIVAIAVAALDVWLYIPQDAPSYSLPLSTAAVAALLLRRRLPFITVLATIPGFMVGWSQLAAMIALGFLAHRKGTHWQMWVGATLVLACRFVLWPPAEMAALSWGEHLLECSS
jgi:hypothetical protein